VYNSFQSVVKAMRNSLGTTFKSIVEGTVGPGDYQPPFIGIEILGFDDIGRVEGNRKQRVNLKIRAVFIITQKNRLAEATQYTSLITNFYDGIPPIDGVQGFDDFKWSFTLPSGFAIGDTGFADATASYTVIVPKGAN